MTTGAMNMTMIAAPQPPPASLNLAFWFQTDNVSVANTKTGTGDTLTFLTGSVTLLDAATSFDGTGIDVGQYITIAGATSPGNNGTFPITSRPTVNSVTFTNAAGVTEGYGGTWALNGRCDSFTSRDPGAYTFTQVATTQRLSIDNGAKPGHKVLHRNALSPTGSKYLARTDATLAGLFNGNTACTMGFYGARITFVTATIPDLEINATQGGTVNMLSYKQALSNQTGGSQGFRRDAGGASNNTVTYTFDTAYHLYARTYVTGGTSEEFVDGVSIGTVSNTIRSPAGLTILNLSMQGTPQETIYGGWFAANYAMSAGQLVVLKNYYAASFL